MNYRLFFLIILAVVVYTANIGGTSVYILDEAKNAGCAMEMYNRHDLVVPTFNGELRTDKPPLHYFFMQAAFSIFDVTPFSARLFSSMMGVLTILSVFLFVRILENEEVAFFSSLILLSSIQMGIQFHLAVPDPYLIFFLTTGLLSFFTGWKTNKKVFYYLFYVCIAFATLVKGPMAILLPGLILSIFLLIQKRISWKDFGQYRLLQGVAIFCLIALPWYVMVGMQTQGIWLEQFLFKHNVGRFTKTMEGHKGFPLASLVILIVGTLPFSLFIPQAIKNLRKIQHDNLLIRFCLIAVGVIVVFFAFSKTILPTYPEPAIPFFAIILGYVFYHWIGRDIGQMKLWINALVYFIITAIIPFAVWIALKNDSSIYQLTNLSYYFIILTAGALLGLIYIVKGNLKSGLYAYAFSSIVFMLVFFYIMFPQVDQRNPVALSKPLFKNTKSKIVYYKDINPAFIFSLQQTIPKLSSAEEVSNYFDNKEAVYIISQKRYLPELQTLGLKVVFEGQDLFEKPITIILERDL